MALSRPEFIERADAVLEANGLLGVMKEEVARVRYTAQPEPARLMARRAELHGGSQWSALLTGKRRPSL